MKIGRMISETRSIYEHCEITYINFGGHLCVYKVNGQTLYLGNFRNYNNIFNIEFNGKLCLPIEEVEVFNVVKK